MNIIIEIRDCDNRIVFSEEGSPTDTPILGGTFLSPDFGEWHRSHESLSCDCLTMNQFTVGSCSRNRTRFNRQVSEFGIFVCEYKLIDCDGNCVELDCAPSTN